MLWTTVAAQMGKPERLEYLGIFVEILIVVERYGGRSNRRPFWYEGSIGERVIF